MSSVIELHINMVLRMYLYFYREWFKQSCLTSKEFTLPSKADDVMLQSLLDLLSKSESISIIASR